MSERANNIFIYILLRLVYSVYYPSTFWISHSEEMAILGSETWRNHFELEKERLKEEITVVG